MQKNKTAKNNILKVQAIKAYNECIALLLLGHQKQPNNTMN